jgi:O-antigen ligase/polysaccharide polymerase Wzy-like membrane protein
VRPAQASVAGAAGALTFVAMFFGGGPGNGSVPLVGVAAVLAACALLVWVQPSVPAPGGVAVALASGLVVWTGVSIIWSAQADRSWDYLNRGLVYLAFGAVGLALGSLVERRVAAAGFAALLGLVAAWALAGKAIPALGPEARVARLRSPVAIWNELALLGNLALPLALWLATSLGRAARVGGALLLYAWLIAIALTVSRGGVLVAVLVVAGWLLLSERRLESVAALVVAGVPAAAVAGLAFGLDGVTADGAREALRRSDGAWFGVALLLGAAVVAAGWLVSQGVRIPDARRRAVARGAAVFVCAVVLAGGLVAATRASSWWDEFKNPARVGLSNEPTRHFTSASSNNRWRWWTEAWRGWKAEPVQGNGAGTFELVHRRYREDDQNVTEPHNLPLQFLAETGIVGGLLFVGLFGAAAWAGYRREPATLALWLGVPAYFLHGLLEVSWDFLATTAPVFLVGGVLLARPGGRPRPRLLPALLGTVTAGAVAYSLLSPWLAERALDRANLAASPAVAVREAKRAHALNPLSIEPLRAWAIAEFERGKVLAAYRLYLDEVELQPENPTALCDAGQFELVVLNEAFPAYTHLNDWYTVDRRGSETCLALLDQARDRVNAGG